MLAPSLPLPPPPRPLPLLLARRLLLPMIMLPCSVCGRRLEAMADEPPRLRLRRLRLRLLVVGGIAAGGSTASRATGILRKRAVYASHGMTRARPKAVMCCVTERFVLSSGERGKDGRGSAYSSSSYSSR